MPHKSNQEEFINKSRAAHGDRYDYSLVNYVARKAKIKLICPTHGVFEQQADNHINGHGCAKCRIDAVSESKRGSLKLFLLKAHAAHGDRYDYSQVNYVNCYTKVLIICSQHGPFQQSPDNHYSGAGCQKCANVSKGDSQRFIARARQAHGDSYDYSQVDYKSRRVNVNIICSKHGVFEQSPSNHMAGKGCLKCAHEAPGGAWKAIAWASRQRGRTALLYLVCLNGGGEQFYKVGITLCAIKKRLSKSKIPYHISKIAVFASSDAIAIHQVESFVKRQFKSYRYHPNKSFGGRTECYTDAGPILEFLTTQSTIQRIE